MEIRVEEVTGSTTLGLMPVINFWGKFSPGPWPNSSVSSKEPTTRVSSLGRRISLWTKSPSTWKFGPELRTSDLLQPMLTPIKSLMDTISTGRMEELLWWTEPEDVSRWTHRATGSNRAARRRPIPCARKPPLGLEPLRAIPEATSPLLKLCNRKPTNQRQPLSHTGTLPQLPPIGTRRQPPKTTGKNTTRQAPKHPGSTARLFHTGCSQLPMNPRLLNHIISIRIERQFLNGNELLMEHLNGFPVLESDEFNLYDFMTYFLTNYFLVSKCSHLVLSQRYAGWEIVINLIIITFNPI